MNFSEINKIARGGFLPTKKIIDLEKGHPYMVTALKQVTTKFGQKIVAELDGEFDVFLPKRISDALEKKQKTFDDMMDAANKMELFLEYKGGMIIQFSGK